MNPADVKFRLRIQDVETKQEIFQYYSLEQIMNGAASSSVYFKVISVDRCTDLGYDKTDIYENDIVEVDTTGMNYRPEKVKGMVKFIDGCFTVEFEKPVYDAVLKWNRERLYVKCFIVNHAIKVIGTTYVNKELLDIEWLNHRADR